MDEQQPTPPAPPENPRFGGVRALLGNIAAGFRLALFMPVRREEFRANVNQAVYILLIMALADLLYLFLIALPYPTFNIYGAGNFAAGYLGMLMGIWILAAVRRATHALSTFVVILAASSITLSAFVSAGAWFSHDALDGNTALIATITIGLITILWMVFLANRAQRLVLGTRSWKNAGASLLCLCFVLAPAVGLPQIQLWYPGRNIDEAVEPAATHRPIDVERTFYAQRPMVDAVLAGVEPGRRGVTDLYFLGFAGYGNQDVFMKEVAAAQSLFDDRFDTSGRSVALINNRATVDDVPLANGSNLRLALAGLAERMDLDEDVLFLFLTSHGSPKELSASFWPLNHNGLNPQDLRAMLDDAGIRWRVIVVSACYSGSFIEALKSEETLVMTAARKDRTSFGCSDEAEFTYFGRALVDEALRNTRSFVEAFGMASVAIAEREAERELTPSEPQIFIGRHIRARLGELEDRLREPGDVAAGD